MKSCDVLIVGAGPTGLVLALWLTKLGISVRIIDKTGESGTTSRALAVQARTLELYQQLDLADAVIEKGLKVPAINLWARGKKAARLPISTIGAGFTRYTFVEIFPQDEHERLLVSRLEALGVFVERQTELLDFSDDGERISARLHGPGGEERCESRYIAGCDGARSRVREIMGSGFPGGTYRQIFYVADVEASGPPLNGELHVDLDEADFLAIFPLAGEGRARLVGTVRDDRAAHDDTLKFEDISDRAITHLKVHVERVNWFSTYHVHHRVTDRFRNGRAFLLGDAAHVHSPVGGQGMNTGIGDAINVAWKLAAVIAGHAPDALLDSYEAERIAFARRLVMTTDRVFTLVNAEGRVADILRTRVFPFLAPKLTRFAFVRRFLFRTVSQIMLNYRGGSLSRGIAGKVHGGDRLPWVKVGDGDNFDGAMQWQVHVYGSADAALATWCREQNLPLREFAWRPDYRKVGLAADTAYLLRPDTYVAVAGGGAGALARHFAELGVRP